MSEQRCGLCGGLPTRGPAGDRFFGGNAGGVDLHHDVRNIPVGHGVLVTCYEAWTTYNQRPSAEELPESMLRSPGFDTGLDEGIEFVEFVDFHDNDELSW